MLNCSLDTQKLVFQLSGWDLKAIVNVIIPDSFKHDSGTLVFLPCHLS